MIFFVLNITKLRNFNNKYAHIKNFENIPIGKKCVCGCGHIYASNVAYFENSYDCSDDVLIIATEIVVLDNKIFENYRKKYLEKIEKINRVKSVEKKIL